MEILKYLLSLIIGYEIILLVAVTIYTANTEHNHQFLKQLKSNFLWFNSFMTIILLGLGLIRYGLTPFLK